MSSQKTSNEKTFFGHPRGLFTLFSTELWERFSYYGMKALLIYYMYDKLKNGGLGLDQGTAASIMSVYGALVYMSGIIGGWIADRILGGRRTIFYGGILIMCGHIALSFPGGVVALFISMVFIIIGTGLLKPNVANVVGDLYTKEDIRRDAGFSIYYMGVNLGAFIAPYIAGTLGQKINYHLGFSMAAIGMALGLIFYVISGRKTLGEAGTKVPHPLSPKEKKQMYVKVLIGLLIIALLVVIGALTDNLTVSAFSTVISILGVLIPLCYFIVMLSSKKTSDVERSRLLAYIPLFIAAVIFWSIEEQGSVILAIYADQRTQLSLGGFTIASSWFQSLNPVFIVVFAPVLAALWTKLGKRQPITPHKFSLGLVFAGLSFLIMVLPALISGTDTLVSPLWLVASFFLVVRRIMSISSRTLGHNKAGTRCLFSSNNESLAAF
ncbi:putative transporter YclF [Pullulanibacillus camelliae]|uniref:Putative transporter YclF n=1 Tax=Pullulanibacillus camelliae TaxID=1707096 RepID=A0A8J2VQK2_9BACL|nr:putative transporter YclF [Pullulanibacillus camelliae]